MKIVFIGPGIQSIPPVGWGAVESLIWDMAEHLKVFGHEVVIVNTKRKEDIVAFTNACHPDVVHLQYDEHIDIMHLIECKRKFVTSHYGYLDKCYPNYDPNYNAIFKKFVCGAVNKDFTICALSPSIAALYKQSGVPKEQICITPNGANEEKFQFHQAPRYGHTKSLYLAKIEPRKCQYKYQNIQSIDFVGNCIDTQFNCNRPNYLGEWKKDTLYENMSHYGNLVLLSDGEAHPLVVCEALICGLGLVLSSCATANLDLSLPWIDVIPDDKLHDLSYIEKAVITNRQKSVKLREQIRQYGLDCFSWKVATRRLLSIY